MFTMSHKSLWLTVIAGLCLSMPGLAYGQRFLKPTTKPPTRAHASRDSAKPLKTNNEAPRAQVGRLEMAHKDLGHASHPPNPVAWQVALDQSGFSPGLVDGLLGPKTRLALRAFQAHVGLEVTGMADDATRRALRLDARSALCRIVLSDTDVALIGPWPKSWHDKAKAKSLGYESLAALAAERGHCSLRLLAKLNPGKNFGALKPGDSLIVPNAARTETAVRAASIEVDFGRKVVWVLDGEGQVVSLFHCSIAADPGNLPAGPCRVATIAMDPAYVFDPAKWPEVKNVDRRLVIPPGPRNPVGLCWIGLSLKGFGIHGTPAPELIGKTGSHGCIRLTNWDALRLAEMVRVGTPVRFVGCPTK